MAIVRRIVVVGAVLTAASLLAAGAGPRTQSAWSIRFLLGQGPFYVPSDSEKRSSLMFGSPDADFGRTVDIPSDANTGGAPWSQPVQGVRVCLRAEKRTWVGGEVPRLWLDVRNAGSPTNQVLSIPGFAYLLQVDGAWFRLLAGGRQQDLFRGKDLLDLPIELNRYWTSIDDTYAQQRLQYGGGGEGGVSVTRAILALRPGKHLIRVALLTSPKTAWDRPGWSVLSNAVEIEIVSSAPNDIVWAGDILWGEPVNGLRLGVDCPTKDSVAISSGVRLLLYVANSGEEPVTVARLETQTSEPVGWTPGVTDANGRTISVTIPPMDIEAEKEKLILNPGDVQLLGTVSLGIEPGAESSPPCPYCRLKPGTYFLTQTHHFSDDPAATWHGDLTSAPLKLVVEPSARQRLNSGG